MQETSREAHESIKPDLKIRRKKVLEAIRLRGNEGATLFELVKMLGRPVNEISGRVTELHTKDEAIEDIGRRKNPDTGRNAIVWRVKTKALN